MLDEFLTAYGQSSDTLGLVDGGGVSFGNIGTGYPYPFPTSQITYRSPVMNGFRAAVGIMDPVDGHLVDDNGVQTGKDYQDSPRFETELTYQFELGGAQLHTWLNGMYQQADNTGAGVDSVTSRGLGYGLQAKLGQLSLTGSGFNAEGVNPFFTNNATQASLRESDSKGYLLQGSYAFGKTRVRSEEHTSELQSRPHLVCRLLLEKKKHHQRSQQPLQVPVSLAVPSIRYCASSGRCSPDYRRLLHRAVRMTCAHRSPTNVVTIVNS